MLVIQINPAATGEDTRIYPADRCSWVQVDAPGSMTPGQYSINSVTLYRGNDNGFNIGAATGDTIQLGVLGKSGRFTPITELHTNT